MRNLLIRSISLMALCAACVQPAFAQQGAVNTAGRLQQGDSTLDTGEYVDAYTIEARAGQQLDIRMTSTEIDPYLIVRGPGDARFENDDEGEGSTNARINDIAPATGTYRISATTFEPGESGSYRLQASATGGGQATRPVGGGSERQNGSLAQGDAQLGSGEFSDAYTIAGRAGQNVDIRLTSDDFDTYMMLRGPDGSSFDNDDGEGTGTNSQLTVTLPATGSYRLVVTSYRSGETGAYTLETRGAATVAAAPARGSGMASASGGQQLTTDGPVSGRLAAGDPTLDDGEFFDVYTLAGDPGARFEVEMESADFDTYLGAVGSGGYEVSNDDNPNGRNRTNSLLEVTIPDSGEVTIAATSYAGGATGTYTLAARPRGYVAQGSAPSDGGQSLALGQNVAGTLSSGEAAYLLTVDDAGPVRLALTSDAFDPMLRIEGPGGFSAANDDAAGGTSLNSLIETTLPEAGTYRVVVTSYNASGQGTFRLESGVGSGENTGAPAVRSSDLVLGGEVAGTLASGDDTISSGEFIDTYRFSGSRGQRVTFDMASSEFDTYLSLQFPGGGQEENDDRAGAEEGATDSRLTVTLPEDGEYQLVATSYQPGETGSYALRMREADIADVSANPSRPNSRVFALSVGVADYERMGSLNLTDQDALKLTQALQATGMMAPESVTLVNSDATRESFIAAIDQISASIGPDDLFLLFFSGHGSKNDVERFVERDGTSETIELFDAAISDFELAQMIEPIAARTLLVLDSCFSGGFDGLINSRVGRMGVFSSDSDLTSLVADKFEAGGYISHILQLAVEGRADANQDSAITAGELSEFMRTTFYQIALAEPLETTVFGAGGQSASGYQHIVVNRGGDGMPYEEVLVNLVPGAVTGQQGPGSPQFALGGTLPRD